MNFITKAAFLPFLMALVVGAAFTQSQLFYYPSLTSYYFYCIVVFFVVVSVCIKTIKSPLQNVTINYTILLPVVFFGFIAIHGLTNHVFNLNHNFAIFSLLFFCGALLVFFLAEDSISLVFKYIIIIASLESAVCCLQFFGLLKSSNSYFQVTGTWGNPNVTAMSLALVIPLLFMYQVGHQRKLYKYLLALLIFTVIILQCRTAYIASVLSICICTIYYIRSSKSKRADFFIKNKWTILIILILVTFSCIFLYQLKKKSADGRLLVYKNSWSMIKDHPLKGVGYGSFEKSYNIYQTRYMQSGKATDDEFYSADWVKMAYNEFLQSWVEGGVGGLLTLIALFSGILIVPFKRLFLDKPTEQPSKRDLDRRFMIAAYSGIAGFAVMSFFNFTFQAIPATAILLIYLAVLVRFCSEEKQRSSTAFIVINSRSKIAVAVFLLVLTITYGFKTAKTGCADYKNKQAADLMENNHPTEAANILKSLSVELSMHESYWINYAVILIRLNDYPMALKMLDHASQLSTNPKIYALSGYCNEKLGNLNDAAKNYQQEINIHPSLFKPRISLMNVLIKANNLHAASNQAKKICLMKPKISSRQSFVYQQMALQLLGRLDPQSTINPPSKYHSDDFKTNF